MKEINILELFGGIGACSKALKRLGYKVNVVDYVEIDKYAVASYNAINGTNFEPQDITTWDKDINVDLIMHGSPCQDFSSAGLGKGGDKGSGTRSSLMYETIRIVEKLKPKYVIWENVKNLLSKKHRHNFDAYLEIMEQLGYTNYYQVLNAKDYGIPQNRERVFTISILGDENYEFPPKQELTLTLKDMLEDEVDEKYYLNNVQVERMITTNYESSKLKNRATKENDIAPTLCARDYKDPKCVILGFNEQTKILQVGNFMENKNFENPQCGRVYSTKGISPTLNTMGGGNRQPKVIVGETEECLHIKNNTMRIRKLTPKECWRLMGFDDEDFEKAAQHNSNMQLYKQAGNSIVVDTLEAIFNNI